MRAAYDVAQRSGQPSSRCSRPLPEGTLMAAGRGRPGGGLRRSCWAVSTAPGWCCWSARGNNGGDALHAGARLARRGARVEALLLGRPGARGGARRRCAGPAAGSSSTPATATSATRPGARRHPRHRRPRRAARPRGRGRGRAPRRRAGRGRRRPQRRRRRHRRGRRCRRAGRRDRDLRRGQAGPARRPRRRARRRRRAGRHRARPAAGHRRGAADRGRRRPCCRRADRESDKYRRGVVGVAAGSAQYTGAAVLCVGGALRGGAGMVRYLGADEPAALVRARWPEVVVGEGRVQAWAVGSGAGDDAADRLDRALADDVPRVVDADALEAVAGRRRRPVASRCCSRRTPASWPGWSVPTATTSRPGGCTTPRRPRRSSARSCCSRGRPRWSPARTDGSGSTRPAPRRWPRPAPATCWPACAARCWPAGSTRSTPGSVGAWLHGLAGRLAAAGGAPLAAGDVLAALPHAFRRVLTPGPDAERWQTGRVRTPRP